VTSSDAPDDDAKTPAPPRKRRRTTPLDPLPDPRLAPIGRPEPEHVVPPRLAAMKSMGGVGTLGLEVALSIMVGLFGGQWLDGRFDTSPWLTLLGSAFGLTAAVRAILRQMRIMKREAAKEEALEGNPAPLWESNADRKRREDEEKRDKDEPPPPASAKGEP
jgi:ATP synthase protein I